MSRRHTGLDENRAMKHRLLIGGTRAAVVVAAVLAVTAAAVGLRYRFGAFAVVNDLQIESEQPKP